FGEGDHVADRFRATDEHDEPVEAESDAAVRRCAETESAQEMAELLFRFLARQTEDLEHLRLQIAFVDADAAAADLNTVQDNIVRLSANVAIALFLELWQVLGFRSCKG